MATECFCPRDDIPGCCAWCPSLGVCLDENIGWVCDEAQQGRGCRNISYKTKKKHERFDHSLLCDAT